MTQNNSSSSAPPKNAAALTKLLSAYQNSRSARSIWQLINSFVPYALLWYLAYLALGYSFWLALPVIILASGFMVRVFIIFHDCGHQSFFSSRKANNFWGRIAGVLTFTPYRYWTSSHAKHHATSGNLDKRGYGDVWMMTLEEYLNASPRERLKYRLYRHPFVMFFLGPIFITLINHRIPKSDSSRKQKRSVYTTNLAILAVSAGLIWLMGFWPFVIIQFLTLFIAHVIGVWLFYVQHQFEGVYWERSKDWDFVRASLEGGSFYKLPAVLRWFTGNIGYHHIHHLNPGIPNYNLPKCQRDIPVLDTIKPVKLLPSLKAIRYRLWDEEREEMVGFRAAHRRLKAVEA